MTRDDRARWHAPPEYQHYIDGLRAVSVAAVLGYHLHIRGFGGGYVGVDVFFVISGYLITDQIVRALAAGTFSFAAFYARRARRILPALTGTLVLSFVAALLILSPEQLQSFASAALAAIASVANIYYQLTSGYFDAAASTKPLLHTWSLSVEEQFYLVYPLALFLVLRIFGASGALIAVLLAGVVSFLLNLSFQDGQSALVAWWPKVSAVFANGPVAIFYFTPFRIFEFAIGAALVWLPAARPLPVWLRDSGFALGLSMIGAAIVLYSDTLVYPSYFAVLPCLGAALVIACGGTTRLRVVLTNAVAKRIGLVSYSLYLVHWPLIVFWTLLTGAALSAAEILAVIVLSYALAEAMYLWVEQPYRRRGVGRLPLAFGLTCLVAVAAAAYEARAARGWPWRLPAAYQQAAVDMMSPDAQGSRGCTAPCIFGQAGGRKVLVVGDSQVDQYSKALEAAYGDRYRFYLAYSPSCFFGATLTARSSSDLGPLCEAANRTLRTWLANERFDAIIVGQRWPGYRAILNDRGTRLTIDDPAALYRRMLGDIDALYAGFAGPVTVLMHSPVTTAPCFLRPRLAASGCRLPVPAEEAEFAAAFDDLKQRSTLKLQLVTPSQAVCRTAGCDIVDAQGRALYSDVVHLSVYGARRVLSAIAAGLP